MGTDWDWELTKTAKRDIAGLDDERQQRVATKLDEIVEDPWRDPADHLEPLRGTAHSKLRIGGLRLGCRLDRDTNSLVVLRIRRRGGDAYRGDD